MCQAYDLPGVSSSIPSLVFLASCYRRDPKSMFSLVYVFVEYASSLLFHLVCGPRSSAFHSLVYLGTAQVILEYRVFSPHRSCRPCLADRVAAK